MSSGPRPKKRPDEIPFGLVLDHMPDLVWLVAEEGVLGSVNLKFAEFLGRRKEDFPGAAIEDVLPAEMVELCRASRRQALKERRTVRYQFALPDHNGVETLLEVHVSPVLDAGMGDLTVCCGHDVTGCCPSGSNLARSERNFRTLIESFDDIIVIGDTEGRIRYVNPATTRRLGWELSELVGRPVLDLNPSWAREEAAAILQDMFAGKREVCPLPLVRKDGTLIPAETRVWLGEWDGTESLFGLCRDLSKEQEALQKFDRFFRMNPALMAVTRSPDRVFIDVNESFLDKLGYAREEVVGRTTEELDLFPDLEEQAQVREMLIKYGAIHEIELKVRAKDGTLLTGLFSGDLIQSQGEKFLLTVMIDISQRKQAEEEREQVIRELNSALDQIRTLSGIIPICAHCKKIRDDRGYWERVEDYITRHSEASFSHGICPECYAEIYPDPDNP